MGGKVKKGWIAVRVGLVDEDGENEECQQFKRFLIPISYLHHPLFQNLLETSKEVYGYTSSGPLKLPCSVEEFLHIRCLIERSPQQHNKIYSHSAHFFYSR